MLNNNIFYNRLGASPTDCIRMPDNYLLHSFQALSQRYPLPQKENVLKTFSMLKREAIKYEPKLKFVFDDIELDAKKNNKIVSLDHLLYLTWQICLDEKMPMPIMGIEERKKLLFDNLRVPNRLKKFTNSYEAVAYRILSTFQGLHPDIFLHPQDTQLLCQFWFNFFKKNLSTYSVEAQNNLQAAITEKIGQEPDPITQYLLVYNIILEFSTQKVQVAKDKGCLNWLWQRICGGTEERSELLPEPSNARRSSTYGP